MLTSESLLRISKEIGAPVSRVEATVALLEGGATIPFIARYRKEVTGNLDEVRLEGIEEARLYYSGLEQRRASILASIEKQGKLTDELKQKIMLCFSKGELEDLYLPFKSKKKTKAGAAIALGLGPLADYIWQQIGVDPVGVFAQQFVSPPEAEPDPAPEVPASSPPAAEPVETLAGESVESPAELEGSTPAVQVAQVAQEVELLEEVAPAESPLAEIQPLEQVSVEHAAPVDTEPVVSAPEEVSGEPGSEPAISTAEPTGAESHDAPIASPEAAVEAAGTDETSAEAEQKTEDVTPPTAPEAEPLPVATTEAATAAPAAQPRPAPKKRRINSVEEAIEGALHILAERVAEDSTFRKELRDTLMKDGVIRAHVVPGKDSGKTKYEMYYRFEETVPKIPSHRMLAIRRGTRENVLTYTIDTDVEKFVESLLARVISDRSSQFAPFLDRAVRDSFERLLAPSIRNEVRAALKERSESEAIRVFEENLKTLLLAPPAGPIGVIGIDPGIRTGCKVAVVDTSGSFLESQLLQLADPGKDLEAAEKLLVELVQKHNVKAITIGNGTASRETESFVRAVVQKNGLDVVVVVVNEAGASVYSASKRAREEFPGLDVTVRGAISIARRLQDPLAELVKIDPRSIGVGQYQHDVDQKKLKQTLDGAVASSVNRVGVDLNTASRDLLKYVAGIGDKLAANLVARRTDKGTFKSRSELMEVEGFGDKTYEQAAGFLRIKDGENPLDATAVHPESYPAVEKIAASLNLGVAELLGNFEKVRAADFKTLEEEVGRFTLHDIREELLRPGRDPRDKFVAPKFREDVKEVVDLKDGMELEGRVSNVTNFGAFVDLGVHQDGLVHISELSHRFIQDARQAVKVGDVVKVKVIGVDPNTKRISLSMKALIPKPARPPRRKKEANPGRPAAAQQAAASAGGVKAGTRDAAPVGDRRSGGGPSAPRRPRPENRPRPEGAQREGRQDRPPKPMSQPGPPPRPQSMEEMIQALQAKFSGLK